MGVRVRRSRGRLKQGGSTLLEVLVAMLIMAFGLLSLAVLTVSGQTYVKLTQFQTVSASAAAELGDLMRANSTGFQLGFYDKTAAYSASVMSTVTCAATTCTPKERASQDVADWANSLKTRLPGSDAYIAQDKTNPLSTDIWIIWVDPDLRASNSNGLSVQGANDCPTAAVGSGSTGQPLRCMYFRISV